MIKVNKIYSVDGFANHNAAVKSIHKQVLDIKIIEFKFFLSAKFPKKGPLNAIHSPDTEMAQPQYAWPLTIS